MVRKVEIDSQSDLTLLLLVITRRDHTITKNEHVTRGVKALRLPTTSQKFPHLGTFRLAYRQATSRDPRNRDSELPSSVD